MAGEMSVGSGDGYVNKVDSTTTPRSGVVGQFGEFADMMKDRLQTTPIWNMNEQGGSSAGATFTANNSDNSVWTS
ncbi:MAG: hypothetical protein R3Y28_02895 [Candidatus Gastranaerophilales bacterium]